MKNLSGLIGIARKGGFVIIGQDNLRGYQKKMFLLLLDVSAGNALRREINFVSEKQNVPIFEVENLAEISGIEKCKVLGVKNKALSESIIKILKGD